MTKKKTLFNTAELYKKYHKDVIENGMLYHLASPQTDNRYIMQCVNASKTCSLILFMNILHEKECFRYLKLKGLDSDKRYKNNFDGCVFYGDYYMNVGLNFSGVWRDGLTVSCSFWKKSKPRINMRRLLNAGGKNRFIPAF